MNIRLVGTRPLPWLRASLPLLLGTALLIPRIAVAADGLRVGSAAVDLEADDSMIIAGGIEGGRAKGQEGKLRCVAVVIEKDDARVAIVACDVLMLTRRSLDPVMAEIQQRFGIPPSHTLINCTHTHHVPSTMKVHDYGPDEVFTRRVQAIRIGDIALVGVPAEYFTQLGIDIKNRSPFRYTYVAELANDWIGYLPNLEAHKLGGYQVWTGLQSYTEPGTGERIADEAVRLLKELAREDP